MEGVLSLKRRVFWSQQMIKVFGALVFLIALPIYLYIGFQPAASMDYTGLPTLKIGTIGLDTPVARVNLYGSKLEVPDFIAGVYSEARNKQFIMGHSSTVFKQLDDIAVGAEFVYNGMNYQVTAKEVVPKSEVDMTEILAETAAPTIVMMTCAGQPLENQDATHRLIVTAEEVYFASLR